MHERGYIMHEIDCLKRRPSIIEETIVVKEQPIVIQEEPQVIVEQQPVIIREEPVVEKVIVQERPQVIVEERPPVIIREEPVVIRERSEPIIVRERSNSSLIRHHHEPVVVREADPRYIRNSMRSSYSRGDPYHTSQEFIRAPHQTQVIRHSPVHNNHLSSGNLYHYKGNDPYSRKGNYELRDDPHETFGMTQHGRQYQEPRDRYYDNSRTQGRPFYGPSDQHYSNSGLHRSRAYNNSGLQGSRAYNTPNVSFGYFQNSRDQRQQNNFFVNSPRHSRNPSLSPRHSRNVSYNSYNSGNSRRRKSVSFI